MENIQTKTQSADIQAIPVKYCLYARKSTEQDEKQALSIDSQIKEMMQIAKREGLNVVEVRNESHSAKAVGQREVFNSLLTDIKAGKFNGLLTWAPDRLSRNAGDLGALVDLMDQGLLAEIRTFGQKFTNNPNEKFLLMILGSQAKLENDNKRINVKRGLRARCEAGLWPAPAPTGYLSNPDRAKKCEVIVDKERAPIIKKMFEKSADGISGRQIFRWLREINFKTKNGKHLTLSNVYIILNSTFYYGEFEYPKKSGKIYQGRHTPLITKELFNKAREVSARGYSIDYGKKEFAFTKMMKCGLCGSGITADEKLKKLKNGGVNRYVYYGCTRSRDINCKSGYLREKDLINQLASLIDKIELENSGLEELFRNEVKRSRKFMEGVLGIRAKNDRWQEFSLKNYAKYLLLEGSLDEKRDMLCNLKTRILLSHKTVCLGK